MKDGLWQKEYSNSATTPELENKTIGIVGFGEIGRAVKRKLSGFNMNFLIFDPFVDNSDITACGAQPAELTSLLSQADFVTLHAKLSGDAKHMIGEKELNLMKPTAFLVNSARADLVDEKALASALSEKRISGAALDVYSAEPLPTDHPFMKLDNITLTPHLASSTLECLAKSPQLLVNEILNFADTGQSKFIVNPEVLERFSTDDFCEIFRR
jgi:D-3-phosphoglycerate dehydrogenase